MTTAARREDSGTATPAVVIPLDRRVSQHLHQRWHATRNHMETMIQPKVTGYRQLTEAEVALMNEGKALAEQCGAWIEKLRLHPSASAPMADAHKIGPALDQRWISIGATDLQRGFMAVIRGIAQPTTF